MILSSAVVKLKRCVGDALSCEEGARSGAGGGGEVRRGLIRDIMKGVCVGVLARGACVRGGGSMLYKLPLEVLGVATK